jgi:hypothetical protein
MHLLGTNKMTKMSGSSGVVYVASGKFHSEAAAKAAHSVRETNPWLTIDLFTDDSEIVGPFDQIHRFEKGHKRSKVDYLAMTRFNRTLYLDSDTRVVADLKPAFELLSRFDLAIAHAHKRNSGRQTQIWQQDIPEAFPQHNGGVILYRGEGKAIEFMRSWSRAYHEAGFKWDQITLRELMWNSDLAIYVLPPEYNVRYKKYLEIWTSDEAVAKILHLAEYYDSIKTKDETLSWRWASVVRRWLSKLRAE